MYKTIKAASADGWHHPKPDEYGGEEIALKNHRLVRGTKSAVSATEWRQRGYKVISAEPHGYVKTRYLKYAIWRHDQVATVRKRDVSPAAPLPPTKENVLACIFTVNRSAKRQRNAASACYEGGAYAFATIRKENKEYCYLLKGRGIIYAASNGWLVPTALHGGLCMWRGDGYRFHSTLSPQHELQQIKEDESHIYIEAKPKESKEPRVRDALETLKQLPEIDHGYKTLSMPKRARSVTCYHCGEEGHIARECTENEEADMYDEYDYV